MGKLTASRTHFSQTHIVGTLGYIAREFQDFGHMSAACDVYSFGVLMLAVLTGLPVFDQSRGKHVRDRVKECLENGDLTSGPLVASSCAWGFPGGGELFRSLLQLGVACCHSDKDRRPQLPAVLQRLRESMEALKVDARECLVCMSAPRATVLEPCRHAVACAACAAQLLARRLPCPVCRARITALEAATAPVMQTFVARR